MSKIKQFIIYWLPPILWMLTIFYFSSRPRFGITHKFIFDFLIFKTLHMIEYAVLYFLFFRAFHQTSHLSLTKKFLYSFLLAFLYAVSDEIHQSFIPTRDAKIRDIIIDTIGISLAYYFIKIKKAVFYEKV